MAAIRAPLQYVGPIKRNLQIVDGRVDNGYEYGNWDDDSVSVETSVNGLKIIESGGADAAKNKKLAVDANTQYVLVITPVDGNTDTRSIYLIGSAGSSDSVVSGGNTQIFTNAGEQRLLVTSVTDVDDKFVFINLFGNIDGQYEELKIAVYKVEDMPDFGEPGFDPLTSPLPTSGQPVTGNSFLWTDEQRTIYPDAARTDTADVWHVDHTDAVPEAKLVPITSGSIIWNDQYFWNSPCMLMYNQSFSGDDLTKIQQFMGF